MLAASKFNSLALSSLYISIGNDITSYFWSEENRINVFICGLSSVHDFLIMFQPILKTFTVLETVIQWLHLLMCNILDIFAP